MKMTLKDFPGIIIALMMVAFSCKKDDGSFQDYAPALAGTWRFVRGTDVEKYLVINKDRTCSMLSADVQGIRDRNEAILLVTGNQIMIDNSDPNVYTNISIYNYVVKGDSLKLSSPLQNITLLRDKKSTVATTWIKSVLSEQRYTAPVSEPTDITYDGSLIWYGNGYTTNYIYSINPATGGIDSLSVSQFAWSVEADSNDLWVSSDGSENITRIKKSDGSIISASAAMGAWIYGIAKDEDFLWCYSNNEQTLYKYKITDNSVPMKMGVSGNWDGLAMANKFLYVAANGKLHKCTTSPFSGIATYELAGYRIFGVAWDGSSFWVSAYSPPNGWPEIIKLSGVD